jgi:hypothetical protein
MPVSEYTPTVAQVAAHIRARTKERGSGSEAGTFTANTRPTLGEAESAISDALNEISPTIGSDLPVVEGEDPNALRTAAKGVVSLLSAMIIESSFYPEQIEQGRSNYQAMERRYNAALKRLTAAVEAAGGVTASEGASGGVSGYMRPSYDFGSHRGTTMHEPH